MHDPMVVAHEIIRPWPQRTSLSATGSKGDGVRWRVRLHHDHLPSCAAKGCTGQRFPWWKPGSYSRFWRVAGQDWYWPSLVTVWHREPGGHDSGEVCPHTRRTFDEATRKWRWVPDRRWRWHVHHFRLQVVPLQNFRRWALTRCAWCGGRPVKGNPVNVSHSWNGLRSPWWRGERGLFHRDCSLVERAHALCLCEVPSVASNLNYGECQACGKFRPHGRGPSDADKMLAALPGRSGIPAGMRPALEAIWAARRQEDRASG